MRSGTLACVSSLAAGQNRMLPTRTGLRRSLSRYNASSAGTQMHAAMTAGMGARNVNAAA
jgi:hypothetical protein